MTRTVRTPAKAAIPQEICIDLPGESVQCWRSSSRIKVILRKHRDIFFDINLGDGALYTVESRSEFYSPRDKKILKKVDFWDGTRFHIWVGRNFKDQLILRANGNVVGAYKADQLDACDYGADPKVKPEPMIILIGKENRQMPPLCASTDSFDAGNAHQQLKIGFEPRFSILKEAGSKFDYQIAPEQPAITEYVAVTEASANEIRPEMLKVMEGGTAVEGRVEAVFFPPRKESATSPLYMALASAVNYISGSDVLTSNLFKEPAGYFQENYRNLDRILMMVRVEKKPKGNYRVVFKGRPLTQWLNRPTGASHSASAVTQSYKMGAKETSFIDGHFSRTGKAGYGSVKRIMLTASENFRGGVKIQVIGTIIDLFGDASVVYFSEKGSRDLSEFLGRAGVSVAKAGATAMLGSVFAAAGTAIATAFFSTAGIPVVFLVGIVIGGYVLAATLMDNVDNSFEIKERIAKWAR